MQIATFTVLDYPALSEVSMAAAGQLKP